MCVHTTKAILLDVYRNFNEQSHVGGSFWNGAGKKFMKSVIICYCQTEIRLLVMVARIGREEE